MKPGVETCLDDDSVGAYLDGRLPVGESQRVEHHLGACETCRKHVSFLAQLSRSVIDPDAPTGDTTPVALTRAGSRIGRFVVERTLGAGGMGVVFLAHDPELDRKVAIKVLHPELWEAAGAEVRLKREAQAMAKLSHPNIVPVFDVGTHGNQLVLTMEYVDGVTLDVWCRETKPPWRAVLAACIAAGRGLAAAHAGGVIHRDFKPQNVLHGKDGRIVVTDFGLARSVGDVASDVGETTGATANLGITRTGTVMGTPAFMAPEQFAGKPADEKSDQWNYCATVYRLLHGEPAFPGTTFAELAHEVTTGAPREPSKTEIPPWVRRVLVRGLQRDPAQRYPAMTAVLADLERDPAVLRRRIAIGGVVGGLLAVGLGVVLTSRGEAAVSCDGGEARLAGIWDASRKREVERAFLATNQPHAAATFKRVAALLDRAAGSLVSTHRETCEATHVRGGQSAALLDLRMSCLDRRVGELDALVDLFIADTDRKVLDRSIGAAAGLPPAAGCANAKSLLAIARPDRAAGAAIQIAAMNRMLDHADALDRAGKYPEGLAFVTTLMPEVETLDDPLLRTRALGLLGVFHTATGDDAAAERVFREALLHATTAGDDLAVAKGWSNLISVVGARQGKIGEGKLAATAAEAALTRVGGDQVIHALVLTNMGAVLLRAGKPAEAYDSFSRALPMIEAAHGPDHPHFARLLSSIGGSLLSQRKFKEARPYIERALAIQLAALGPEHPELASHHTNISQVHYWLGEYDKAWTHRARALALIERVQGTESASAADARTGLANIRMEQGKYEEAIAEFARVLEIRRKTRPADHTDIADDLRDLGEAYRRRGNLAEADAQFRAALAIRETALGPTHAKVAASLTDIARVLEKRGKFDEARVMLERALKIREAALGAEHHDVASTLTTLAIVMEAKGDLVTARRHYERALAIREKVLGPEHHDLAGSLNNLGDLLGKQHKYAEAKPYFERALRVVEAKLGSTNPRLAAPLHNLGEIHRLEGNCKTALGFYERALGIWKSILKPDHPDLAHPLTGIGRCKLALGKAGDALPLLERALALRAKEEPQLVGETELALARTLIATGGDRSRAVALGKSARARFAKAGARRELAEATAWLARPH
ncbi:MAG TPA: tetratricopeptide repeat protein [Kofleriaceae bacterium]